MCEGLSKISINFALHLIKTDLANFRFPSFEKGEACQSILITLRGETWRKKVGCVWRFLLLEEFKIYLSWNIS